MTMVEALRRYPLVAYFVLAYVLTWWVYPLLRFSPFLGLFGLFGPALAAIIMAAAIAGRSGVKDLLRRLVRWRVGARWYLIAFAVPALLTLLAAGLNVALGGSTSIQFGTLTIFEFVIFVLVVGEELGWRGFALPRLLEKRSALVASLILGVLWGLWHLPTFVVPGTPQYGRPFVAFVLMTTAYSVLITWIFVHTAGSVLIATLVHGAINFFHGFFLGGVDPARQYWLMAAVYGAAAIVLAVVLGPSLQRRTIRAGRRAPADRDGDPSVR
jgi:uncharacterized protein